MQSVGEIKEILSSCPVEKLPEVLPEFAADSRKGVQSLVTRFQKKYDAYLAELERLETLLTYERECYEKGFELVAGIDEVGRGPLAGPVVAAAVILPKNCKIAGVNDSKKLSAQKREELCQIIKEQAVAWAVGVVSNERIDEINILQATYEAMREALVQTGSTAGLYPCGRGDHSQGIHTPERHHQRGCEKHFHRCRQHCGKGYQRCHDGRHGGNLSSLRFCFQ